MKGAVAAVVAAGTGVEGRERRDCWIWQWEGNVTIIMGSKLGTMAYPKPVGWEMRG